jgi:hypothetical protein
MIEPNAGSTVLWDTLKLSAQPLRGRSDILVSARVKVQEAGQEGSDDYNVSFELNRHHGIVSHDTEVFVPDAGEDSPPWRYSGRRDILVAVKDHFLTTQLYSHMAGQLGWIPASSVSLVHAPLDP